MRIVSAEKIKNTVGDLCVQANLYLRKDALGALKNAYCRENDKTAKEILKAIIENASIAKEAKLPICQDTGLPVIFIECGQEIQIQGDLKKAVNKGVELGYKTAYLRDSIVAAPLCRKRTGYSPAVIHFNIVRGDKLKITVLPKGFGSENKTQLRMFKPTAEIEELKKFIIEAVKNAGPDACPPYVVGVGIGGTADYACLLAKKALLRKVKSSNQKLKISKVEKQLFLEINKLNIGPMGLGGKTTCLSVNIETYPTHIAGLPVCVNIGCHALRSASKVI